MVTAKTGGGVGRGALTGRHLTTAPRPAGRSSALFEPRADRPLRPLPERRVDAHALEGLRDRLLRRGERVRREERLRLLEVAPLRELPHRLDHPAEEHRRAADAA